jgi:hypothetical protein
MQYNNLYIKLIEHNIKQYKLSLETEIEKTRLNRLVKMSNERLYKSIYLYEYKILSEYFKDKFLDSL